MNDVLIVDDSALARMIVRRSLSAAGLAGARFAEAPDGAAALAILQNAVPDLVVADLNMPELDGEGLLRAVRADRRLDGVPFLVSSSAMNPAKEERLRGLGAAAVLRKPFSPGELRAALAAIRSAS